MHSNAMSQTITKFGRQCRRVHWQEILFCDIAVYVNSLEAWSKGHCLENIEAWQPLKLSLKLTEILYFNSVGLNTISAVVLLCSRGQFSSPRSVGVHHQPILLFASNCNFPAWNTDGKKNVTDHTELILGTFILEDWHSSGARLFVQS